MASDAIRVNGNVFSWGSLICKVESEIFHGFDSISYADKRERVKVYGMGRHHAPRGRTSGKYTVENVKIGGPKGSIGALRAGLAAKATDGKSYGNVEFQIVLQYIEYDETSQNVEIERCVWASNSSSEQESPDPLKEEIELDVMFIRRNGLVLFDSTSLAI